MTGQHGGHPASSILLAFLFLSVSCSDSINEFRTYKVGGVVTGLGASAVVLQNNGGDDLTVTSDGSFTFVNQVADGSVYTVSVAQQPEEQLCSIVENGAGIVTGANVSDVKIECVTQPLTEMVSVASDSTQGNLWSDGDLSISADGRYVAFMSQATNLVAGDTNSNWDIFIHDRETQKTTRVSVSSDGAQATNSYTYRPSISADGRFVAFESRAPNLVAGDTNNSYDVFVHDQVSKETTRVSVSSGNDQSNGASFLSSISADGRFVSFSSCATNLVAGDTGKYCDVFVHDRVSKETTRVSVASDGSEGSNNSFSSSISADGRFVAFLSRATNLAGETNSGTNVFVHDRLTGETSRVSSASDSTIGDSNYYRTSISSDGRFVAFPSDAVLVAGDTNGLVDVFVHDRSTGETSRASLASDGTQGNLGSYLPSISADGRFVAFVSDATTLMAGDMNNASDIFVHDRMTGGTTLVSASNDNTQGNSYSFSPSISGDGRYVAFSSFSNNLVDGDTNGFPDVFVRRR